MKHIGLYIHIPFCDGKCYYCNFFSKRPKPGEIEEYVRSLNEAVRASGLTQRLIPFTSAAVRRLCWVMNTWRLF